MLARRTHVLSIVGMRDFKNFEFGAPFFVVSFPLTKYEASTIKRGMTKIKRKKLTSVHSQLQFKVIWETYSSCYEPDVEWH